MPALSKEQQKFYENALDMTKRQIDEIDSRIEEELARVKERLAELQNDKKNVRPCSRCPESANRETQKDCESDAHSQ